MAGFDIDAALASSPRAPRAPSPAAAGGGFDVDRVLASSPGASPPATAADLDAGGLVENKPAAPAPGAIEATLRGLKQGATLGFGDELTGLVESLLTKKSYEQARDEARAADKAAKEAHPWLYGAGEVGGGAATMLVPGLGEIGGGIKGAAALGAAAGLGGSDADLTKGEIGKAALDTATGAATGAALGFVGDKLGKWVAGAPARAEEAEIAGLKQGVQNSTKIKAFGKAGQNEADILTALRTHPEIRKALATDPKAGLAKVQAKLGEVGEKLDGIYDAAQEAAGGGGVPVGDVVRGMKQVEAHYRQTSATKGLADQVATAINNFTEQWAGQRIPFQDLRSEYRAFQDMGFEGGPMFSVPVAKQLKRDIATAMRDVLQEHVERVAEARPELGISREALRGLNREASTWSRIESLADEKATRAPAAAPPLGGMLAKIRHPLQAAGEAVKGAGEALDARLLGPTVRQLEGAPLARRIAATYPALQRGGAVASPDLPGLALRGVGQALTPGDEGSGGP